MARRPSSRTMPLARRREPAARWRAPRSARRRCAGLHHSRTTPDSEQYHSKCSNLSKLQKEHVCEPAPTPLKESGAERAAR
mmetsp:Transcript_22320/g.65801  ORF Transcript_22320/g.65801 Transcript_22320/m.65801 type:complete len:81 (+) Transcript_22320:190-432(+)